MRVELVTIGDELLRGATVNSNAAWLGRELTERGVTVTRVTTVPDDIDAIASAVRDASKRADAVITTGGLGPTHDDRTMEAIAAACGVELERHRDATEWMADVAGVDVDGLAPGTLDLPAGARFVPNEVGLAPGAVIENIYVLPGVPDEMEAMFGHVADDFTGPPLYEAVVDIAQPEREIAPLLETMETKFDLLVGSYPGSTVRVRILGRDQDEVEAAAAWLRERVDLA